ncbi:MAG: DUF1176 domain-containing protein [Pseudomonadota bacterium]
MPVFALILSVFWLSTPHASAETAKFGDWSVECRASGYCAAQTIDTTSRDLEDPDNVMIVARHPETESRFEVSVRTFRQTPQVLGPAVFRIAGQRPLELLPNRDYTLFDLPNEFFLTSSSANQAHFRRLLDSRRVFVTIGERGDQQVSASFSLIGLSAALLWIDDQQNRVGARRMVQTPIKRDIVAGEVPASGMDVEAETLAWEAHKRDFADGACDIDAGIAYAIGTAAARLDAQNVMVRIPCFSGAYNTSFSIYVVHEPSKTATLQLWAVHSETNGWVGSKTLSNVGFDTDTGLLNMIHKGRGIGDCGMQGTWQWTDLGFKMISFAAKHDCDGDSAPWPTLYSQGQ